jgi:hypothetical protein
VEAGFADSEASGILSKSVAGIHRDRDVGLGQRSEPEPLGRGRHLQGLVRSVRVVLGDPAIELGLGDVGRRERAAVQELPTQALVEPLDLAGGGG